MPAACVQIPCRLFDAAALELGQLLVEALSIALQLFRLLDVLQQTPVDQLETIVYLPLAVLQLMQLGKRAAGSLNQGLV